MYFTFLLVERNIIHTGVPSNFPLGFERNSKLLMGLLKYHGPWVLCLLILLDNKPSLASP